MNQIKSLLQEEFHYTDLQMQKIRYMIMSFASEISKLLLIFVFFAHISKVPELIVSVAALLSVRNFTGGIHLKHYFSCLLLSFGIFYLGICVLPSYIAVKTAGMIAILLLCLLAVYIIGPVLSSYRPALTKVQKKCSSLKASAAILLYIIIILIVRENSCLYAGFWIIVLQTLQLGLAKIINKIQSKKGRN